MASGKTGLEVDNNLQKQIRSNSDINNIPLIGHLLIGKYKNVHLRFNHKVALAIF